MRTAPFSGAVLCIFVRMKGNCNLFCSLLGGLFLSLSIVACGDESTSIEPTSDYDYLWNSEAGSLTFPCEKSREGNTAYAESENAVYVCKMEGDTWEWRVDSTIVPKVESSSSSGKSSSSRKRGTSNPGKMIDITPYLNEDLEYGEFKDPRDGQTYKTIVIGDLEWFAQNLNYDYGDTTLNICMDFSQDSCAKYGRLYSRAGALDSLQYFSDDIKKCNPRCYDENGNLEPMTLQGVCPDGWRLGNSKDFHYLRNYVNFLYKDYYDDDLLVRSQRGWSHSEKFKGHSGFDFVGFSALPSGVFFQENRWNLKDGWFLKPTFEAWSNEGGEAYTEISGVRILGVVASWRSVRCVREIDWSNPPPEQPEHKLLKGNARDFLNPNVKYGELTDERDGQKYKTVQIGDDTWMAQNLNYKAEGSRCGGGMNADTIEGDCSLFGRLYGWLDAIDSTSLQEMLGCDVFDSCDIDRSIQGICPSGWHLPDTVEINALLENAGAKGDSLAALRTVDGWKDDWKRTNATGFSALPAGLIFADNRRKLGLEYYADSEFRALFWVVTKTATKHSVLDISAVYDPWNHVPDGSLLSVRCVKDR